MADSIDRKIERTANRLHKEALAGRHDEALQAHLIEHCGGRTELIQAMRRNSHGHPSLMNAIYSQTIATWVEFKAAEEVCGSAEPDGGDEQ